MDERLGCPRGATAGLVGRPLVSLLYASKRAETPVWVGEVVCDAGSEVWAEVEEEREYRAAMGRFGESCEDGEEGDMVDDGERVRDRATSGSCSVKVGEWADGGRRARQKVSFSLISSCTYLTVSSAMHKSCRAHLSSLETISQSTSCRVRSLGPRFAINSSSAISDQLFGGAR
jgi:hypothetical protein